jgi:hypothetical protein
MYLELTCVQSPQSGYGKGEGVMGLTINFTPTGMIPTKEMTPCVPIMVDDIVKDIR